MAGACGWIVCARCAVTNHWDTIWMSACSGWRMQMKSTLTVMHIIQFECTMSVRTVSPAVFNTNQMPTALFIIAQCQHIGSILISIIKRCEAPAARAARALHSIQMPLAEHRESLKCRRRRHHRSAASYLMNNRTSHRVLKCLCCHLANVWRDRYAGAFHSWPGTRASPENVLTLSGLKYAYQNAQR